jgi:hypothetical protein
MEPAERAGRGQDADQRNGARPEGDLGGDVHGKGKAEEVVAAPGRVNRAE